MRPVFHYKRRFSAEKNWQKLSTKCFDRFVLLWESNELLWMRLQTQSSSKQQATVPWLVFQRNEITLRSVLLGRAKTQPLCCHCIQSGKFFSRVWLSGYLIFVPARSNFVVFMLSRALYLKINALFLTSISTRETRWHIKRIMVLFCEMNNEIWKMFLPKAID